MNIHKNYHNKLKYICADGIAVPFPQLTFFSHTLCVVCLVLRGTGKSVVLPLLLLFVQIFFLAERFFWGDFSYLASKSTLLSFRS